jgi:23S rRNA (uridine2552-2'-O)-methyltransferase
MAKSSKRWLQRHVSDPFVRRAQAEGYRSRAAYKLIEIDRRDRLLKPGMRVVDLGAAPGGWSQVAARKARPGGRVVAVDLLDVPAIGGVTVLKGDFQDPDVLQKIVKTLNGKADLVLCDMSPNLSGIAATDQARAAELVLAAIEFCRAHLKADGSFLVKVFQGGSFGEILKELRTSFHEVQARKPAASRGQSRETYLLARGLKPIA